MTETLAANMVVMFAAFIQTASGIGFAMIAVPLLALIDLSYIPGPSLLAMLILCLVTVFREWREVDRDGLAALLPGLAVGTVIGALSLGALPASAAGPLFGIMVLAALAAGQIGFVPGRSTRSFALSGTVAGLMGTMAGIHGPALAVLYQRTPTRTVRATIAAIFVVASSLSLLALHLSGQFDHEGVLTGLALWPGALAGYALATFARHLISERLARRLMLGLAGLSALLLIAESVW